MADIHGLSIKFCFSNTAYSIYPKFFVLDAVYQGSD